MTERLKEEITEKNKKGVGNIGTNFGNGKCLNRAEGTWGSVVLSPALLV